MVSGSSFRAEAPDAEGLLRLDLYAWRPETGDVDRVTRLADVAEADPAPDGAWAVGVRNRYGVSELVRVDLASGDTRRDPRRRADRAVEGLDPPARLARRSIDRVAPPLGRALAPRHPSRRGGRSDRDRAPRTAGGRARVEPRRIEDLRRRGPGGSLERRVGGRALGRPVAAPDAGHGRRARPGALARRRRALLSRDHREGSGRAPAPPAGDRAHSGRAPPRELPAPASRPGAGLAFRAVGAGAGARVSPLAESRHPTPRDVLGRTGRERVAARRRGHGRPRAARLGGRGLGRQRRWSARRLDRRFVSGSAGRAVGARVLRAGETGKPARRPAPGARLRAPRRIPRRHLVEAVRGREASRRRRRRGFARRSSRRVETSSTARSSRRGREPRGGAFAGNRGSVGNSTSPARPAAPPAGRGPRCSRERA